jgi:hypothetical protein
MMRLGSRDQLQTATGQRPAVARHRFLLPDFSGWDIETAKNCLFLLCRFFYFLFLLDIIRQSNRHLYGIAPQEKNTLPSQKTQKENGKKNVISARAALAAIWDEVRDDRRRSFA